MAAMDKTQAASRQSDAQLRAALESGDTTSVQLSAALDINKARNQVARLGFGKGGGASN